MNNLIYFSSKSAKQFDWKLHDTDYIHHQWFQKSIPLLWPNHINSRVHKLNTPWNLANTVCPIPIISTGNLNFGDTIELVADRLCNKVQTSGRTPYFFWSGGIDSTSILVSLLKVANAEFLEKLIIVCNQASINENAYFYYTYIDQHLQVLNLEKFEITQENYDKITVIDGEAGNQCTGWRAINFFTYHREFDFLDTNWRNASPLTKILPGSTNFHIDLIVESIKYAPIPIDTVYDFIWWANFNFKFDDVLLRKIPAYTKHLTAEQTKSFYYHSLYRFFSQEEMQIWSMNSKDERREKTRISGKWHLKDYIYKFDCNDLWYSNKQEEASGGKYFDPKVPHVDPIIAIDVDWHKYTIEDSLTRKSLGKILQRN